MWAPANMSSVCFQSQHAIVYRQDLMHSIDDDAYENAILISHSRALCLWLSASYCADYLVEFEFNLPMYAIAVYCMGQRELTCQFKLQ